MIRNNKELGNERWVACNHERWEDSPISNQLNMGDICWYAPGEANKQGKVGKSSWDTFSYILQMGHNTHHHISATQEANLAYDSGKTPEGLIDSGHTHHRIEQVVDEIFKADTKEKALDLMKEYDRYIRQIQNDTFAPDDLVNDHIDAEAQTAVNKDKTFKDATTRKQHLKAMDNDWF